MIECKIENGELKKEEGRKKKKRDEALIFYQPSPPFQF